MDVARVKKRTKNKQRGESCGRCGKRCYFWASQSRLTQLQVNKIWPLQPPRIPAFQRGLYRSGKGHTKRDLCDPLFKVMVSQTDCQSAWPEKAAFWEADCRKGSLRVVLWHSPSSIDVHRKHAKAPLIGAMTLVEVWWQLSLFHR